MDIYPKGHDVHVLLSLAAAATIAPMPEPVHILPDVLHPGLRLVFCGTAAGTRSAREGAYYAHPGNRFWTTVHAIGLTPRRLAPAEYPLMPGYGIGFTDVAKHHYGNDTDLPPDAFDASAFWTKMAHYQPRTIAFTSKRAGLAALGAVPHMGRQPAHAGASVWVLPSPSGQARRSWRIDVWQALADEVRGLD